MLLPMNSCITERESILSFLSMEIDMEKRTTGEWPKKYIGKKTKVTQAVPNMIQSAN
jgi:hypothetical protein